MGQAFKARPVPGFNYGVALIERGHEVGGGDVRSAFGCQAHIVQNELLVDGRLGMVAVGVRRIRVVEWLCDDPYPRAICIPIEEAQPTRSERRVPDAGVTDAQVPDAQVPDAIHPEWPDNDAGSDAAHALIADLHESIGRPFVLGDWPTDAGELADAMAARLGYGPFDAQRVLCEVSGGSRLAIAASVLAEALEDLRLGRSLEGDG